MKDLSVLKKLLLLCSLLLSVGRADELSDILSSNKNLLFDYEFQSNTAQSDLLENAWINPIMLQYSKNFSEQFGDQTVITQSFSIGIDQPIFRSGGIYYAIKYAQALRGENKTQILLKKREMIGQAVKLLFEMKKLKITLKKQELLIENDLIDIRQKKESYDQGLLESSFLDQAILKHSQDKTRHLESEILLMELEKNFALISDKDPKKLKLPKLKLLTAAQYKGSNLELIRDNLRVQEKKYNAKMTWAKYLPTISLQGRYTDADLNPLFASPNSSLNEQYFTYGFSISMPINLNMFSDTEVAKVAHLKSQTQVLDRKNAIDEEYTLVQRKIRVIDKKIQLAKKDEKLYKRLYRSTKDLEKVGEKTSFDTAMMHNSLQVRKLDQKIYYLDKQIELIGLYAKVANAS